MELLHGDCLEVMKTLPDKSVDLFVCDLPYGCLSGRAIGETAEKKKVFSGAAMGCAWDVPIDLAQFWVQVKRLAKDDHTPVLMFCSTKFGFELYNSNPDWFRYDLVWNKMRGVSFLLANKMPMRSHEMVYVFSKKGATYYRTDIEGDFPKWNVKREGQRTHCYGDAPKTDTEGGDGKRCVLSIVDSSGYASRSKGQHSTQKPDDLYAWLIERYSKEGDTILDPTAGSFASVFTAHRLGRRAIGIEKDENFYRKAMLKVSA
jgi:site-specific DNA-methyltransferase (adenine-specific)